MKTTRSSNRLTAFLSKIGTMLVGLAVGLILGLAAWYLITRYVEVWRYDQTVVSTGFLVTLAVFGYATQEVAERLTGWFRPPVDSAVTLPAGRWFRSLKALLGAVVLPLLALVAANQVSWSGTAPAFVPPPSTEYQLSAQIADAVLASSSPATRVAGIEALQAMPPEEGAPMLAKIVDQDATILNDASTYSALATALAGEGTQSKAWLLSTFEAHSKPADLAALAGAGAGGDGGLYAHYFQLPFAALRDDLTHSTSDPAAQAELLLDLTAADTQLQTSLKAVEAKQTTLARGALTLDFVLDTFSQMTISDDADIYRLARGVAGNPAYPVDTRRRAIGVVAKFGSTQDFDFLLQSTQDKDDSIREAAFMAISTLYHKTNPLK